MTDLSSDVALGPLVVPPLKGVVYRETDDQRWSALLGTQSAVLDYVGVLGLELYLDEGEGYAFRPTPMSSMVRGWSPGAASPMA